MLRGQKSPKTCFHVMWLKQMTQNRTKTLISGAFGNSSSLDRKSWLANNYVFCPEVEKKTCSRTRFDGSIGKPETRFFYRPNEDVHHC